MMIKVEMLFKALLLVGVLAATGCAKESTPEPGKNSGQEDVDTVAIEIEDDLQVIDFSQKQLALYTQHLNTDSVERAQVFRDSLYYPYQEVWNGYVGKAETFDLVADHYGVRVLDELIEKNKLFYSGNNEGALLDVFFKVREGMVKLTGHSPKGKWYLLYGPALTDLGGVENGVMFIDFASPYNTDLDAVINFFPHELNHQIHANLAVDTVYNVLARVINEGFAVYVNKLYWNGIGGKKDYSIANSLTYTEEELMEAEKEWDTILAFFKENLHSEDQSIISQFGARNSKMKEKLPGAIGYYIGYKIVEAYVNIHGEDSWKDIYTLHHEEVLEKSGIMKQ